MKTIKNIMQQLLNQSLNSTGIGLVGVLIIGGTLSVASLGVMKLVESQRKSAVATETKHSEHALLSRIKSALTNRDICTASLFNKTNGGDVSPIKNSGGNTLFFKTQTFGGFLTINSMTLRPSGSWITNSTGTVLLELDLTKAKVAMKSSTIKAQIPLTVTTNASGNITECFRESEQTVLAARMRSCVDKGGKWNTNFNYCVLFGKSDYSSPTTARDSDGTGTDQAVRKILVDHSDCKGYGLQLDGSGICRVNYTGGADTDSAICGENQLASNIRIAQGSVLANGAVVDTEQSIMYSATCTPVRKECPTGTTLTQINASGLAVCKGGGATGTSSGEAGAVNVDATSVAQGTKCATGKIAVLTTTGFACKDVLTADSHFLGITTGGTLNQRKCESGYVGIIGTNGIVTCADVTSCVSDATTIRALQISSTGVLQCKIVLTSADGEILCTGTTKLCGLKMALDPEGSGEHVLLPKCCEV